MATLLRSTFTAGLVALLVLGSSVSRVTSAATNPLAFENGFWLPVHGDIRVLVAFAEENYLPCGGGAVTHPNWPAGQPPLDKDDYYDRAINGNGLRGFLTDYYYQMSFGAYRMTGDYFQDVVTLDCRTAPSGTRALAEAVIDVLNARPAPLVTAHGFVLDDFDQWTPTSVAAPKLQQPNNRIDVLMIVLRNVQPFTGAENGDWFGGEMFAPLDRPLSTRSGFDAVGIFAAPGSGPQGWGIFIHEYFHLIIGPNNMHIGDGADLGSFMYPQSPWGMTAASPAASNVANGWDRDRLKWKPSSKRYYISALDNWGRERPSDISIASQPGGATFVLRDFVERGDAVRIKLPHITWEEFAPKNQYLWLENHQRHSRFDTHQILAPCQSNWRPGLYAQVQVGKDTGAVDMDHDGTVDALDLFPPGIFDWYPNALGSWLLPLSADGRRDWLYRFDKATPGDPAMPCQWGNASMPVDFAKSLPNPFTGYSDLFFSVDSDSMLTSPFPSPRTLIPYGNGLLLRGEPKSVLTEVVNEQVVRRLGRSDLQAFSFANGKTELSIATNPAPVPVYTLRSTYGYADPYLGRIEDWENRTIWLNGLSIRLLAENVDGHGAIKVAIRWDDDLVDRDVRWTGRIVLDNDAADPWHRQSRVIVGDFRSLTLDRGYSPTRDVANDFPETIYPQGDPHVFPPGLEVETGPLFTDPTVMTVKSGTKLHLHRHAKLVVENGSTLQVDTGAEVQLEPGAAIVEGPGGGVVHVDGIVRRFGDLDGNGCVDYRDFRMLWNEIRSGIENPFHDLNEDGHVNFQDAFVLAGFYTKPFGARCGG